MAAVSIHNARPAKSRPSSEPAESSLDHRLTQLRGVGDPLADETVARILAADGVDVANRLLKLLVDNDDLLDLSRITAEAAQGDTDATLAAMASDVSQYMHHTAAMPEWANPDKLAAAGALFGKYGPQIALALHAAALPECYAAADGAQVLYSTQRIGRYTYRRIVETARFVIEVMDPEGFELDGKAVRVCQKVRLMHAAVRHHVRAHGAWDEQTLGVPINQEDLVGTLMAFSVIVTDALQKLGTDLTREEQEAYLHRWCVVGALMGIDADILPSNLAEAQLLIATIRRRHHRPSEAGRWLTDALVSYLEHMIPGTLFDGFATVAIRALAGDETSDLLAVPAGDDWTRVLWRAVRTLCGVQDDVYDSSAVAAYLGATIGRRMLEGVQWVARDGERVQFVLPRRLVSTWRLGEAVQFSVGGAAGAVRPLPLQSVSTQRPV